MLPANHDYISFVPTDAFLTARCAVEFVNGTLPSASVQCEPVSEHEVLSFTLTGLGQGRPEFAFRLGLESRVGSLRRVYRGSVDVGVNTFEGRRGRVVCTEGVPYDGLRCGLWDGSLGVEVQGEGEGLGLDGGVN